MSANQKPHTISIVIDTNGKINGTVSGVLGPSCEGLAAWLDELGEVEHTKKTGDYYKTPDQTIKINR